MPIRRRIQSLRRMLESTSSEDRAGPSRQSRLEMLEPRQLLTTTLAPIENVVVQAGAPLHIALDGFDSEGDPLTFQVQSSSSALTTFIPQGNDSLQISVTGGESGDMVLELFEGRAPRATGRIKELAESGFYDGVIFHRVISNFMIQGGDPNGTGSGGSGVDFDDEFHPDLVHTSAGVLSMAKSFDDTNDSQFFITTVPTRHLDFNHSVFGFLTEGNDVLREIETTPASDTRPITPVVMESVTVFEDTENAVLMLKADPGTTGTFDVTVTARDSAGHEASQVFQVSVVDDTINNTPVLGPLSPIEVSVNEPIQFSLTASDVEPSDPIFYSGWSVSQWQGFTINPELDIDVNPTSGAVTITPDQGLVGVYGVLLGAGPTQIDPSLVDPRSLGSTWDLQFVPVFIGPGKPTVSLTPGSDTGEHNDDAFTSTDLLASDGKSLSFFVSNVAQNTEIRLLLDGQEVAHTEVGRAQQSDGTYLVTVAVDNPGALSEGTHQVTVSQSLRNQTVAVGNISGSVDLISDVSAPLDLTVDNTPPVINSQPSLTAAEGRLYEYDVETVYGDDEEVFYQLILAPTGMNIDPASGDILWTPSVGQASTHVVKVRATDLAGHLVEQQFEIVVSEAPVISPIPPKTVDEGQTVSFAVLASGGQGTLTFRLDPNVAGGIPDGASIDSSTGVFTWAPSEAQGPHVNRPIKITVTDDTQATASQTVLITVREVNQPPTLESISNRVVDEGADFVLGLGDLASDLDLPANPLTYELLEGPQGATIDASTGVISWIPDESQGGETYDFRVRVSDASSSSPQQTFSISVEETQRAPRFVSLDRQTVESGETLEFTVEATDPDLPSRAVRYEFESGAPADATIDTETGRFTWLVPEEQPTGLVSIVVLATEIAPEGETALSSRLTVEVWVDNRNAAMIDAALTLLESQVSSMLAGPTSVDLTRLSDDTGFSNSTSSLVLDGADSYDDRGFFGTQFGLDTGLGHDMLFVEEEAEEGEQEKPGSKDNEPPSDESEEKPTAKPDRDDIDDDTSEATSDTRPEIADAAFEAMAHESVIVATDDEPNADESDESEQAATDEAPEPVEA